PQRDRRLARGRREQPVEVVAREVGLRCQRRAVRRLVERVQHEIDQFTQAVGHVDRVRHPAGPRAPTPSRSPPIASSTEFPAAPGLAEGGQTALDAHKHKTLATLRKDVAPRISGTETIWRDGALWIGSMRGALKAKDLQRDPRFALHSATFDPDDDWPGEAKL